ncbi:P-loop NTPase [Desulfosarcina sp.]|nr:P-loop NTPase [Desulfosarcina sp.]
MKQILVISGKGGTGKTVITSAFASLVENKVMVDCDVDAADLHILLQPEIKEWHVFKSGYAAMIDQDLCLQCGKCIDACRFDAIVRKNGAVDIDPVSCEGCGFCSIVCPQKAIRLKENEAGEWYVSQTRFGEMVHAKLGIAEENSGKLVSQVRKKAQECAQKVNAEWIIIDGSPGIGCPVIASLSGVDLAVVVTEPTMSGLHDADRVIQVARHFKVPVVMVVNKYDLNDQVTTDIESFCSANEIPLIGKIPFDEVVVKAMLERKTIIEYTQTGISETIRKIWKRIENMVLGEES